MVIACCGMSRSGSTLQYQLVARAAEKIKWGKRRGFGATMKSNEMPEYNVIVKSEEYRPKIAKLATVAINIQRDPRDVAISLHHFYSQRAIHQNHPVPTFDETVDKWLPQTIGWQMNWRTHPGFINFKYENYYPDNFHEMLLLIARHMQWELSREEVIEIAEKVSLDRQVKRTNQLANQNKWIDLKDTMLTKSHISPTKGRSTWKDVLTFRQIQKIQNIAGTFMDIFDYPKVGFYAPSN